MRLSPVVMLLTASLLVLTGCKDKTTAPTDTKTSTKAKFGINPYGTDGVKPDFSKLPTEITKTFDYIDTHIDEHVENLQKWVQQPSISNSGEGIPESAEMVKGFFDKLGCQTTKVYDVGITEYGSPGNPVVYAKCDEGAPKTVAFYWMYDTMPVTQPDLWVSPPFEGRIVDGKTAGLPNTPRVMIGRGSSNSKGHQMVELNALMAYKAVNGKLPVNVIFIAEGDEERMDVGLRKFMTDHSDLLAEADALYAGGPSEGCVYVELTTSGLKWGRGPGESDVHGSMKRTVDSVAWRHIQMLSSLTSKDGNTPIIKGFFDNKEEPTAAQKEQLKQVAGGMDLKKLAAGAGVMKFMSDDPYQVAYDATFGTSFNLDGIWGGNMYAGGAGAILPNRITSKHNFRYVPSMNGLDIVKKLRAQLDANGYKDVELKLIGDVPWSRGSSIDTDISHAHQEAAKLMGLPSSGGGLAGLSGRYQKGADSDSHPVVPGGKPGSTTAADVGAPPSGGYWPSYLFTDGEVGQKVGTVKIPMGMGGHTVNGGGRNHAANEYYVVETRNWQNSFATQEKDVVATLYEYAKITTVAPKPKTTSK
ncbi:Acetylornithine deacetylase/Succinyl-diaminopimelate desuccinylase [Granulicella rosea]|uniref:Acetylornithine deacetylase/Succinyl-diaminopimelate desuccinylase n=1 Tax=Granulicella rosea TaxID=474952 RepID=A0A239D616_9BACT|nr:M20/M25/M40 family metallo-hydrolase [Granulicella rosea]SNS27592.1 Acetylornithine deacetylase/Succinyl-diaminopimelate desuccinylase [Granulicella rosea]